ncbi:MAG: hypothetical protein MUF23_11130 [Pirellula sp.]|jgi:hypothetical protein|nr:hypothetical protein [Pirellula sp.]
MDIAKRIGFSTRDKEMVFFDSVRQTSVPIALHCFIIALVSIYDMYLTVKYAQYLKYMEQNPVGRWLMQLDQLKNGAMPDLTLFLSAKSVGTLLVLLILALLYHHRRRIGHPVALGVTSFQVVLAWYLTVATTQS